MKFILGTFALGLVTTLINSHIQSREIELKEQDQLGQFVAHALQEDVGVRLRFAQYFSTVTRSDALRQRWKEYLILVQKEFDRTEEEKQKLEMAVSKEDLDAKEREKLFTRIAELEQALSPKQMSLAREIPPRVYFHIREESQRDPARAVADFLARYAYTVPGIQKVAQGPAKTELRYFRRTEKEEAESIVVVLKELGIPAEIRYFPGYEGSTSIRPRHYELWFTDKPIEYSMSE